MVPRLNTYTGWKVYADDGDGNKPTFGHPGYVLGQEESVAAAKRFMSQHPPKKFGKDGAEVRVIEFQDGKIKTTYRWVGVLGSWMLLPATQSNPVLQPNPYDPRGWC